MIQRIQSFYLVLAVVCMILMFRFPIATYTTSTVNGDISAALQLTNSKSVVAENAIDYHFVGDDMVKFSGKWVLTLLVIITGVIALVSLFLFKNRVLQMRVVAVGFLLSVLNVFLVFIWAVDAFVDKATAAMACTDVQVTYGVSTWAMIAAAVLMLLAQRSIKKDEEKVRAADRLRG
jgi:hypothetical protein